MKKRKTFVHTGWSPKRGEGKVVAWVRQHATYAGDDCLIFPFSRNNETGYGTFGYLGKQHYAHRFMCELVHGPAPSPKHYAVHSCGNGHDACVHPKHVAWDTSDANASDRVFHGRQTQPGASRAKLTQELADQIRDLKGHMSQYDIARDYNISRENVARIHRGVAWTGKPRKQHVLFNKTERAKVAERARQLHREGKTYDEIAEVFGISRVYASNLARGVMV